MFIAPLQGAMNWIWLFQWLRFACHWLPSSAPGGAQRTYWAKRVKARKQIVVITVNP
jgi:hypothetical protein